MSGLGIQEPLRPVGVVPQGAISVGPGMASQAARRFFKNRLAVVGLVVVVIIGLAAIFADVLAPYPRDLAVFSETLDPPSAAHPLGTDAIGRDFLSRVLHGARTSMLVGLLVPLFSGLIGIPLGALAAWRGGWFDFLFLRVVEIMTAIPSLIIAVILVTILGSGLDKLIFYFVLTGWIPEARLARAQFVALRPREFVLSARALGASEWRLAFQHILPNAIGPMIVSLVIAIPGAIFGEAGLSVLGLGIRDPIPSWGKMIAGGAAYVRSVPLLAIIPTVLIGTTMLAYTFVGDGLRDALDPNSKQ
jgi:oligopeptide transport system permease protein